MLIIRNAKQDELERLFEIESKCFPINEAATKEAMKDRIKVINDTFLVAELDNKAVGLVNGPVVNTRFISDDLFEEIIANPINGGIQTILGLAVDPEYQKQGIAAKLLEELANVAKKAKREAITLTCKDYLIKYYESQGYTNMGKSDSTHGGEVWYNMTMEL
ncbi:ribosomal protein S18 acetylase RimI-like enzyme [Bacilli bacterium PM5-3]|nr:ribosomal protein S18 acetylase RimI-like enzyme [Bacilli bacterium PM5-3]